MLNILHMTTAVQQAASGVEIRGKSRSEYEPVLTSEAIQFVAMLQREFNTRREERLARREARKKRLDVGELPDFLSETKEIRDRDWTVAAIPADLTDRRVEITGPVDRKMIINALNSGASVFMADFEDAHAPTWRKNVEGQLNVRDAVNSAISFSSPEGKQYRLNEKIRTLLVRPR